ncbi:MAG: hypothetical protein Kow0089_15340 [Desulfobulbaceae bacterium]
MDDKAAEFYNRGLLLVQGGRLEEAIDLFSRAIEAAPDFADAYHARGETRIMLERFVEGNADIHKARKLQSGTDGWKKREQTTRLNMQEVESIYDSLFEDDAPEDAPEEAVFDNSLYDLVFADDGEEAHPPNNGLEEGLSAVDEDVFAIAIEYIGGRRLDAERARLFHPTEKDITLLNPDGGTDQVVSLDLVARIRTSGLPSFIRPRGTDICHEETIETLDGTLYREFVYHEQSSAGVLVALPDTENTGYAFSLFPRSNIWKRRRNRLLGEILVEKRFIAGNILKHAVDEYRHEKELKIGKIIARRARISQSVIEKELEKARAHAFGILKTGEILLASGLVSETEVLEALEYQESLRRKKIGRFLVEKGLVREKEVYLSLAEQHRLDFVDLRKHRVTRQILSALPRDMVLEHEVVPIGLAGNTIMIATHDVEREDLCERILQRTGVGEVQFVLTEPALIRKIIDHVYRGGNT